MHFLGKKIRLLVFLTGRVPHFGWAQWVRGLKERDMAYAAMELAEVLPEKAATIVDVGAHAGLVADAMEFLFRPDRMWVFEPNPAHGAQLESRFRGRPQVSVLRCCLGEARAEVSFNVYAFDAASSLFACKPGHLASLGLSERSDSLKVPMETLSDLLPADLTTLDLLKLDCQGAELSVLKGAGGRLQGIRWVYTEVSIDPIYDGAPLFGELHAFMVSSGFELRSLTGFSGRGRSIQWADALYANAKLPSG